MKEGSIILVSKPKKRLYSRILPPAIRWFTDCEYHHGVIVGYYNNELWVYESVLNGFKPTMSLADYKMKLFGKKYKAVFFHIDPLKIHWFRDELYKMKNTPYDFLELFIYQPIYQLTRKLFTKYPSIKKLLNKIVYREGVWLGKLGRRALDHSVCTNTLAYLWKEDDWEVWTAADFYKKYKDILFDFTNYVK